MILLSCLSTVRIPNIISHQSFYLFNLSKEPLHSLRRHFATYIMRFVNVPGDPVEEFSRWRWLLFCPTLLLIPDSFPPRQSPRKTCFFSFREDWEGKRKPATLKVHIFFVLHTEISSSLRLSFSRKREWILGANPSKKADLENGTWISDKPW